jgi:hypothetical protein
MAGALQFAGCFFAEQPNIAIVYGNRIIIDEAGRKSGAGFFPATTLTPSGILFMCPTKRCSGDAHFTKLLAASAHPFSLRWTGIYSFGLSLLAHVFTGLPISLPASAFIANRRLTIFWVPSVSMRSPVCWRRTEEIKNSYRMRSNLCEALLKCSIRYSCQASPARLL